MAHLKYSTALIQSIQDKIYIIETTEWHSDDLKIYRLIGKHPLLKPALIIKDDMIHGFKHYPEKWQRLENYLIFCEIETGLDTDEAIGFDLYSEMTLDCLPVYLRELCKPYADYVHVSYSQGITDMTSVISLTSRLDQCPKLDTDDLNLYLDAFLDCIKVIDMAVHYGT